VRKEVEGFGGVGEWGWLLGCVWHDGPRSGVTLRKRRVEETYDGACAWNTQTAHEIQICVWMKRPTRTMAHRMQCTSAICSKVVHHIHVCHCYLNSNDTPICSAPLVSLDLSIIQSKN
jgi:hypothetical protein